ncbi:hypothetical protein Clacol_008990 [Clathrus columnatus]|uniref:GH16 domain-containing protein n=1 Tax=Clathrus columnatus TaxID=1419009 RepID=A0AAV5ANT8_9AGAM|nr:hypothetical protein Clacol_008990 [Clathrus columnatus]
MDNSESHSQIQVDKYDREYVQYESAYVDRTSRYSSTSDGDYFESANEDSDVEPEDLSFPVTEIENVSPPSITPVISAPQGAVTTSTRGHSITSQITITPRVQTNHITMESPSPDPFKTPVNTPRSLSLSGSIVDVQSTPPITERNRSNSLSNIRGPTPPVTTRGKLTTFDIANPRSSMSTSSSTNPGINVTFDITPNPIPNSGLGMRSTTTATSSPPPVRETFSSPPTFSRSLSYASMEGISGDSGTSTPSIIGYPSTAASSALALTAHIPGLGGPVSMYEAFKTPSIKLSTDELKKRVKEEPMKSTLLQGESKILKPWLNKKDWRVAVSWWITVFMIMLGVAASAFYSYWEYLKTPMITQPLCLVMEDDFNTFSVDTPGATWTREVDLSGFGNGEFEMTTNSENNSFVKDGMLYIMPTLTALSIPGGEASIFNGFTYNLTGCTNTVNFEGTACGAVSNATTETVINPVMSARITTAKSHSIRYGKVEIRAKIPTGDWLWPALWMLPTNNTYGPWPLSGEIDIMESRGNGISYPGQYEFTFPSFTITISDIRKEEVILTFGFWTNRRQSFADDFHIYSLEWTPTFIRTYVDSRLHIMLNLGFNEPFFTRGQFPEIVQNGSSIIALENPWIGRGDSAPFDQPFYLIMDVAVGGTNGWFPDGIGNKPWLDQSGTAMHDFAKAQNEWYPTWPTDPQDRAMVV